MEKWKACMVLCYLGIHALMDVRRRRISLLLTVFFLGGGIVYDVAGGAMSAAGIAASMLPGAGIFLYAYLTRGKIGYGDGFLLLALGGWLGLKKTFLILTGGMLLCSLFCILLLMSKKARREDSIPFVPFLLLSFVFGLCH